MLALNYVGAKIIIHLLDALEIFFSFLIVDAL